MCVRVFLVLACLCLMVVFTPRIHAQTPSESPIVVHSQNFQISFPKYMRFDIQASSSTPIQTMTLTVWQRGVALGSRHSPQFTPDKNVHVTYEWDFQGFGDGGYLPPGTHGEYTWRIQDAAGNTFD